MDMANIASAMQVNLARPDRLARLSGACTGGAATPPDTLQRCHFHIQVAHDRVALQYLQHTPYLHGANLRSAWAKYVNTARKADLAQVNSDFVEKVRALGTQI